MRKNIITPRLTLRPMADTDADAVIGILIHPQVTATYMIPDLPTREEQMALFERFKTLTHDESRFVYGIDLGGRIIGFLNDVDRGEDWIEVGYVIHPDHWNCGYAAEALGAAVELLFAHGFSAVRAGAFEENPASLRVMEKCGMIRQDHTDEIEYRGITHTCIYYVAARGSQ